MSLPADAPRHKLSPAKQPGGGASSIGAVLSLPPKWLRMYEDFITANAGQVSQIESGLRSLTYIIPGRFRDAEIASETVHSLVQLLSLYHDTLLFRALRRLPLARIPSPHNRYTAHWADKSPGYRRLATLLQVVGYTELLCEMSARRRGDKVRWRLVVLLEAVKALCRLAMLRLTGRRAVVSGTLPEREPIPEPTDNDGGQDSHAALNEYLENGSAETDEDGAASLGGRPDGATHEREWGMPRTGMSLPSLPAAGDISAYLLGRVLTADDIKPAAKLMNQLQGPAHAAEVLHILAPLAYAAALAGSKNKRSWGPWLLGVGVELAARQMRERSLRTTALERDEWSKRGWAMGWWAMRGAFYENVTKGVVGGVTRKMPSLVAGILEDYEYLWENYYFSTSR